MKYITELVSLTLSTVLPTLSPTETIGLTLSATHSNTSSVVHVLEGEPKTTAESVTFVTNENVTNYVTSVTMVTNALLFEESTSVELEAFKTTSSAANEDLLVLEMTTDNPGELQLANINL